MRNFWVATLCCVVLAACDRQPTFDASSLPAYQKSLSQIIAHLNAHDRQKLEIALGVIAAGYLAASDAAQLTKPGSIETLKSAENNTTPAIYLARLSPKIQGRSAAAVIHTVIDDLDTTISRAEAHSAGSEKLLPAIVIENPRYYWGKDDDRSGRFPDKPIVEFSIYNGGKEIISRIYVNGVLTTHGSARPLANGELNYDFPSGLQPGEQQLVRIIPMATNNFAKERLQDVYNADFAVKLINIEDEKGRTLLYVNADVLDAMRKTRDLLRGS